MRPVAFLSPALPFRRSISSSPLVWVGFAVAAVVADFFTGPIIQFPVFYVLPVAFISWFHRARWGLSLALLMPFARLAYFDLWDPPWTFAESAVNAAIRVAVLSTIAVLVARVSQHTHKLRQEVAVLEGLLPVCVYCKRIHAEEKGWEPIVDYVATHTQADFEETVCPRCRNEIQQWTQKTGELWAKRKSS
jgi:hypothetical protein